jgi:myo-inositol-1-phosphate synthase
MAFARGLIDGTGMVSESPEFRSLGLAPVSSFVFGGHEVRRISLPEAISQTQESAGILPVGLLARLGKPLGAFAREIRPGFPTAGVKTGLHPGAVVARLRKDIESFRKRNRLDCVVVVNVASAEPGVTKFPRLRQAGRTVDGINKLLWSRGASAAGRQSGKKGTSRGSRGLEQASGKETVPPSVLYAVAAMESGCAYVNFTSSIGASLPGLDELSLKCRVPHAGRDGKTGETLLKTVLAPMFVARRLKLLSWEGHNLLGNSDGASLRNEANKRAKTEHKDSALRKIVGNDSMHSAVRIDFVPSLADWKTAWDFIHFEGFLGARMVLQLLWQGCDSALAAPLVLDLVRFSELSLRRGESGPLRHLACFFKDPVGTQTHDFRIQVEMLREYAGKAGQKQRVSD